MADAGGYKAKMAFKKDRGLYGGGPAISFPQVPGTTDMAAGHQVPFSQESLQRSVEREADDSLEGQTTTYPPEIVRVPSGGNTMHKARYRGLERMLACAFGYEHPDESPATLVAGAYAHLLEVDQNLADEPWGADEIGGYTPPSANDRKVRRGQIGIHRVVEDWVYYSAFCNKLTIKGSPAAGVSFEFEWLPYDRVRGADYNNGSWTPPTGTELRGLFTSGCEIKHGSVAGGEGAMVNPLCNSFEVVLDNHLEYNDQDELTGTHMVMPERADRPEVTLKFERPRYTTRGTLSDSSLHGLLELDTPWAAKIVCTGPEIAATGENYKLGIFLNNLRVSPESYDPNVQGPGVLRNQVSFVGYKTTAASIFATNHFQGITEIKNSPLHLVLHNEDSGNYLLET